MSCSYDGQIIQKNLKELNRSFYKFPVDESKRAIHDLRTLDLTAVEESMGNLNVQLEGMMTIGHVFEVLNRAGISVLNCYKVVLGSEDRYRKLFSGTTT